MDEGCQQVKARGARIQSMGRGQRRGVAAGLSVLALALVLASCSSTPKTNTSSPTTVAVSGGPPPSGGPVPGVTSNSVTVGQVDDLTIPLPGLFEGAVQGTKAYFDYINSQGGVYGRQLHLDAQDSLFSGGSVATETATQTKDDFALVGGFSLLDSAEQTIIDITHMPDIGFPLSSSMITDPNVYSALPNPANDYPLGFFQYLKKKYPQAVKHVGIIWEKATASTTSSEDAFERAIKGAGFKIIYDRGAGPFETSFLSDILKMKSAGVQMFYALELPDSYAAKVAQAMQQQDFHPINIEGDAYSSQLIKLGGSAVNNMYIIQSYALYIGQDANTVPAVALFDKWMKKTSSDPNFEIQSVYGWTSAELFVQALRAAGPHPTRPLLLAALNKITNFEGNGLVPNSNPAQNVPTNCFLLAQVQKGKIVRVAPTPSSGFDCSSHSFLPVPGYKPEVRPSPYG